MASRVNTKFLVILSLALALVGGGTLYVAYTVVIKSGDDLIKMGDKKMDEAEAAADELTRQQAYNAAQFLYSKAVSKDKSNTEYLDHWGNALSKWIPETQTLYRKAFDQSMLIRRQKAILLRTDIPAFLDYLTILERQVSLGDLSRDSLEYVVTETTTALGYFSGSSGDALRRFRGRAIVEMIDANYEVTDERRQMAREDLEAAMSVDPKDGGAALSLARWFRSEARRAIARGENQSAPALEQEGIARLRSHVEANPGDAAAAMGLLQIEMDNAIVAAGRDQGGSLASTLASTRDAVVPLRPRLDAVFSVLMAKDPKALDILELARFRLLESVLGGDGSGAMTDQLLARAIEAKPLDADVLSMRARVSFERRDFARAIEEYQRVVDLKPIPVSLDGLRQHFRRVEAISQQTEAILGVWELAKGTEAKSAEINRAKAKRNELAAELPAEAPALMLLDAKLSMAEGREADATRLLQQYNERTLNSDVQGLWLLGQVTTRTQPGVARQQFERVLQLQPVNVPVMVALASVEAQLQNLPRAIELYKAALSISPDNEAARRGLEQAEIASNLRTSSDPVVQLVLDARRKELGTMDTPGDRAGAIRMLEESLEKYDLDMRLVSELSRMYLSTEDMASTAKLMERALAKHPNETSLKNLQAAMATGDPIEATISLIDQSDASPRDKAITKYRVYRTKGMTEKAREVLAEAARVAPDDSTVLELRFADALERKAIEEARGLAEVAAQRNVDSAGGLTFKARIEMMQGSEADAIRTLQQAVNSGGSQIGVFRLLGRLLMNQGRTQEGVAAYRRGLDMRPDDLATINELVAALVRSNDLLAALQVARDSERYARADPMFQDIWLNLEGAVGDRALALDKRRKMVELNPTNRAAKIALAAILIETANWAEARKLLDELRSQEDSLQLVELDAKWNADQNNLAGASTAFVNYVTGLDPATLTAAPYISFGKFMLARNQREIGLNALNQARPFQDPKVLEADKEYADALFMAREYEKAAEVYRTIVSANADTEQKTYELRLVEAMLRLEKWDEAEAQLSGFGPRAESDAVLLMLRADAAKGKGDLRRCRELLDKAVTASPDDALVYVERAQARADDPLLAGQAMQDLDRALQLRPSLWQALRLRASLHAKAGRMDEAISDLRLAVTSNPSLNDLRYGLMLELINRGRTNDAAEVAEEGLKQRPGDLMLMLGAGQIFAERDLWPRAASFYRRAWMQAQDVSTAQLYVESLLNATPPDLTEAANVLTRMGDRVNTDPALILARAEILAKRGRMDDARRELTASYGNVRDNARLVMAWYAGARRILSKPGELAAYLELLEKEVPDPWVTYMRGQTLCESIGTVSQGVALLRSVQQTTNVTLGVNAHRGEGTAFYNHQQFDEAIAAWKRGLEKYPDDWEMNNNVAFVLSKKLGRAEEAVPFAERAAKMNPNASEIQDTLGVVYTMTKQYDLAEAALRKAMDNSRAGSDSQVMILVHQGSLEVARGNMEAARAKAKEAEDLLNAMPNARESLRNEVASLFDEIR